MTKQVPILVLVHAGRDAARVQAERCPARDIVHGPQDHLGQQGHADAFRLPLSTVFARVEIDAGTTQGFVMIKHEMDHADLVLRRRGRRDHGASRLT